MIRVTISVPDSRVIWRFWESEDMERGGGAERRRGEEGRRREGGDVGN